MCFARIGGPSDAAQHVRLWNRCKVIYILFSFFMLALINGILINTLWCLSAFLLGLSETLAQVHYVIQFRYRSTI